MSGNNRPSSPTQVASAQHPSGCTCGCLHSGLPKALYKVYRDTTEQIFTGILVLDSEQRMLLKLNDPNWCDWEEGDTYADLQDKGHLMKTQEFCLDVSQYHANPEERKEIKDLDGILQDFKDKPADFVFKPEETQKFDTQFPHGTESSVGGRWTIPQIRTDDMVKIVASKHVPVLGADATERLWVEVLAVSQGSGNNQRVVGIMSNDLENPALRMKDLLNDHTLDPKYELKSGELVAFPVTRVFGVEHGKHWK